MTTPVQPKYREECSQTEFCRPLLVGGVEAAIVFFVLKGALELSKHDSQDQDKTF